MFVEFKTRSGDKWTALRHYDSGPWSGGGNPHWSAINVTLRSVKNNAGIAERKKDADGKKDKDRERELQQAS